MKKYLNKYKSGFLTKNKQNCCKKAKLDFCEGDCEFHGGKARVYRVIDVKNNWDWGYYSYCDSAYEKDLKSGFELRGQKPILNVHT